MGVEAPIQIDLSDDNSWDQVDDSLLTQDDKNRLKEHFTEESEGIIYLTKQEIQELKATIDATKDPRGEAGAKQVLGESFHKFIQEQRLEGLSSSDILSGVENNLFSPELLKQLDALSEVALFEDGGLFDGIIISDSAKDHISVSLTLSLLEQVKTNPQILQGLKGDSSEAILGVITQYNDSFSKLGDIIRGNESVGGSFINGNGENNSIFMETNTGKSFFDDIIAGDITVENIIVKISEHNTDSPIIPTLGNEDALEAIISSGTLTQEQLIALLDSSDTTNINPDLKPPANATPEEKKSWLESLKEKGGIGAIFAAIIEALKGFIPDGILTKSGDTDSTNPENNSIDNPEEIAPTTLETAKNLFKTKLSEGSISPFTTTEIQELFSEEGELTQTAKDIIRTIDTIPGEESFEDKFDNLFGEREGKETTKFQEFVAASNGTLVEEGKSEGENMITVLQRYNEYRDGGTGELYTVWFKSNSTEDSDQN